MNHVSVWFKRLACFDECFEAGEDAWPAVGAGGVGRIVFRPLVMGYGDLGCLGLRQEFYRDREVLPEEPMANVYCNSFGGSDWSTSPRT